MKDLGEATEKFKVQVINIWEAAAVFPVLQ